MQGVLSLHKLEDSRGHDNIQGAPHLEYLPDLSENRKAIK